MNVFFQLRSGEVVYRRFAHLRRGSSGILLKTKRLLNANASFQGVGSSLPIGQQPVPPPPNPKTLKSSAKTSPSIYTFLLFVIISPHSISIFSWNCNLFASTNCLHQFKRDLSALWICAFSFTPWFSSTVVVKCRVVWQMSQAFRGKVLIFCGYHIRSSAALVFLLPSAPYE